LAVIDPEIASTGGIIGDVEITIKRRDPLPEVHVNEALLFLIADVVMEDACVVGLATAFTVTDDTEE
jgi:hypothetical protein